MDLREEQYKRNAVILAKYIPESCVERIAHWIVDFDFKLKIKKERSSKLGDYTPPHNGLNHTITINFNLNRYAFLITLVHEVAHLVTFNEFRNTVAPHGAEWKENFRRLMQPMLDTEVFPPDVLYALRKYLQNPAAASCTDASLLRTLKLYDDNAHEIVFLEYLPYKTHFIYNDNRIFEKGERVRKRFRCKELSTGNIYLFNPLTEVEAISG